MNTYNISEIKTKIKIEVKLSLNKSLEVLASTFDK